MKIHIVCIICVILLSHAPATLASPRVIRRAASLVGEVIQKSKTLNTAQIEIEKGISKLLNQTQKPQPYKKATSSADKALDEIKLLIEQDPTTSQTKRDDLTAILNNVESNLHKLIDEHKETESAIETSRTYVSRLNESLSKLDAAKTQGKQAYLNVAQQTLIEAAQMLKESDPVEFKSIAEELREVLILMSHPNAKNIDAGWLNKPLKEAIQHKTKKMQAQENTLEQQSKAIEEAKTFLDKENGKIVAIRKQIAELNTTGTQQSLDELLQEYDFNLNIQTADTLLKHAKGHALNIAEEKGIAQLDLNNGIKDILDKHIKLDEYRIENFSLEDLEIALRTFTPDEETAFKNALGTNWRQYLFIIENSKTRDGEQLLSLADIQDYKLLQDFVATYLDNLNDLVPEYQHHFPNELLNTLHKHDNNYVEILQYSKIYSQQVGELKAEGFLKQQTESFTEALEDLNNANDEDSILELLDKPESELISHYKATMKEIRKALDLSPKKPQDLAMIHSLNTSVERVDDIKLTEIQRNLNNYLKEAIDIDNIRQSYAKKLLELYGHELDNNFSALKQALSTADKRLKDSDNNFFNTHTQTTNYRTKLVNKVETGLSTEKLEEIRDVVKQGIKIYEELGQPLKTTEEVRRRYEPLGWELTEGSKHSQLTNEGHAIVVRIAVPRTNSLAPLTYQSIFDQARGMQVVDELISRGVLSEDDLRNFITSEQYRRLGTDDNFIREALNPIRRRIGLNE